MEREEGDAAGTYRASRNERQVTLKSEISASEEEEDDSMRKPSLDLLEYTAPSFAILELPTGPASRGVVAFSPVASGPVNCTRAAKGIPQRYDIMMIENFNVLR